MTPTSIKQIPSLTAGGSTSCWDWGEARRHCVGEARRVLRSSAEVEDAAQEALLRVWRSARTPEDVDRPVAWVRRIARNEALRLRARERHRRDHVAVGDALQEVAAPGGQDTLLGERLEMVDLMGTLPPADRQLVWLRYVEDLTQTKVAHRLGIPEGTVKVRLHRARKRLRRVREGF
jgi:RNA polymerase sigma-70 factor, ECF subfamily